MPLKHVSFIPKMLLYSSVSQPMCRDAQVCCKLLLRVPQNFLHFLQVLTFTILLGEKCGYFYYNSKNGALFELFKKYR